MVILLSGSYEKILNYVISMDAMFWALTASCLFVLRSRAAGQNAVAAQNAALEEPAFRVPGHPFTTATFCLACLAVVAVTVYKFPGNTVIGFLILAAGVPVYYLWKRTSRA
jgi:APA family basic amino acid/polyamine antiporter